MKEFQKLPRFHGQCQITEKIDGTQARIMIKQRSDDESLVVPASVRFGMLDIFAGSRRRLLLPEQNDNFAFRAWVAEHARALVEHLQEGGTYFGEWYGRGIGRDYDLDEKRLVLFSQTGAVPGLFECVPVLYEGPFSQEAAYYCLERLQKSGSVLVPGYQEPEGIVIAFSVGPFHYRWKMTFDSFERFDPENRIYEPKPIFHKEMA